MRSGKYWGSELVKITRQSSSGKSQIRPDTCAQLSDIHIVVWNDEKEQELGVGSFHVPDDEYGIGEDSRTPALLLMVQVHKHGESPYHVTADVRVGSRRFGTERLAYGADVGN